MAYRRNDYRDKWRIERTAAQIRSRVKLDQLAVLDPSLLVDDLGARLFYLRDLIANDDVSLRRARRIGVDGCASFHPETGQPMVILNCGKPPRRQTATLMEELAHLFLKHEPSQIVLDPTLGFSRRTFDRAQENEAYDLGAALLLPKERIQRDVKELKLTSDEIADDHNCSEQLVMYRINRMRLRDRYRAYAPAA